MHDISLVGTDMAEWNFDLPDREHHTKHTVQDPNVAQCHTYLPKDLVVEQIFSRLMIACDPLVRTMFNDGLLMCKFRVLNCEYHLTCIVLFGYACN